MNEDQENYPIGLKFHKSLWYILFDVSYKFLRDWVIFDRVMLFIVRTFWFVKIKRKKNSDSGVTFCYILKKFIENMCILVYKQSLKFTNCGTKSSTAMKQYLLSYWAVYMASKTKKIWKNAKMRYFFNSRWLKTT